MANALVAKKVCLRLLKGVLYYFNDRKVLFFFMLCLFSSMYFSAPTGHTGTISKVTFFGGDWGTYNESDDAVMVFYMSPSLPSPCGVSAYDGRIVIGVKHPLYDSVVSTVLAAKMSGSTVDVTYLTSCTKRYNSWDFGYIALP